MSDPLKLLPPKNVLVHGELWFQCIAAAGYRSPRQAAERLGFPACVNTHVNQGKRINPRYARLVARAGGLEIDALIVKRDLGYGILAPCAELVDCVKDMHRHNLVAVHSLVSGDCHAPSTSAIATGDAEVTIRKIASESFGHLGEEDIDRAVRRLQHLGIVYRLKCGRLVFNSLDTESDIHWLAELERRGLDLVDALLIDPPSHRFPMVEGAIQATVAFSRSQWSDSRYFEAANRALEAIFDVAAGEPRAEESLRPFHPMPNRALLAKRSRIGDLAASQPIVLAVEGFYSEIVELDRDASRRAYSAIFDALFGSEGWRESTAEE